MKATAKNKEPYGRNYKFISLATIRHAASWVLGLRLSTNGIILHICEEINGYQESSVVIAFCAMLATKGHSFLMSDRTWQDSKLLPIKLTINLFIN